MRCDPTCSCPCDEVIAAAVDQNRVVAASKHVDIAVRASTKAEVYGDSALMIVAVHNLISNAIAYSNEGGRVGVGAKVVGDTVEIAITDQGVGIEGEDLDRIFERFYRVDQARSRNTGGIRPRPQHRQAHRAEPRRRRARLVAAGSRLDVHDPTPARRGPAAVRAREAREAERKPEKPEKPEKPASKGSGGGSRPSTDAAPTKTTRSARRTARTAESAARVATADRGEPR